MIQMDRYIIHKPQENYTKSNIFVHSLHPTTPHTHPNRSDIRVPTLGSARLRQAPLAAANSRECGVIVESFRGAHQRGDVSDATASAGQAAL